MKKFIVCATFTFFLFIFIFPAVVRAGDPTETVRSTINEALAVLRDPAMQGETHRDMRRGRIRDVVVELIDFKEMTRRSLGIHWRKRTEQERDEFVSLFSVLLENSYISKIEQQTDEKVIYITEKINTKHTRALVKTKVSTTKGTDTPISYRMINKNDRWVVYDIVIEGVSLVSNYRTQFNRIIKKSSYEHLVATLAEKVKNIKAPQ